MAVPNSCSTVSGFQGPRPPSGGLPRQAARMYISDPLSICQQLFWKNFSSFFQPVGNLLIGDAVSPRRMQRFRQKPPPPDEGYRILVFHFTIRLALPSTAPGMRIASLSASSIAKTRTRRAFAASVIRISWIRVSTRTRDAEPISA